MYRLQVKKGIHYQSRDETPPPPSPPRELCEDMMMLCAIDAKEGRYIVVTDIP